MNLFFNLKIKVFLLFAVLLLSFIYSCNKENNKTLLFVGSFTDKKPWEGIHIYEFDTNSGEVFLKFTLDGVQILHFKAFT